MDPSLTSPVCLLLQNEIEKALPPASPTAALQGSPVVGELKQLCEQVETLKAERDVIETEIKDAKCDMCEYLQPGICLVTSTMLVTDRDQAEFTQNESCVVRLPKSTGNGVACL